MATLKVEKRDKTGKYEAFALRSGGYLPGILYGKDVENVNLKIPFQEFEHLLHSGERIVDLEIDGATQTAIIKEVQHGTFAHEIMHADFRAISETDTLSVTVPIALVGEAAGVTEQGGMVDHSLFDLEIECLPRNLPEKVSLDISGMHVGDVLYVSDLPRIEGVTYMTDPGEAVVSCHMPEMEVEEEAEEAAEEEMAAEPEVIGEKEREEAAEAESAGEEG